MRDLFSLTNIPQQAPQPVLLVPQYALANSHTLNRLVTYFRDLFDPSVLSISKISNKFFAQVPMHPQQSLIYRDAFLSFPKIRFANFSLMMK